MGKTEQKNKNKNLLTNKKRWKNEQKSVKTEQKRKIINLIQLKFY
jgi:hypothetical protein